MMSRKDFIEKQFVFVFLNEGEHLSFKMRENIYHLKMITLLLKIKKTESSISHPAICFLLCLLPVIAI